MAKSLTKRVWAVWFDGFQPSAPVSRALAERWFAHNKALDSQLRAGFEADFTALRRERQLADAAAESGKTSFGAGEGEGKGEGEGQDAAAEAAVRAAASVFSAGDYSKLVTDPEGAVAVALLSDVFARRMYRGDASGLKEAFAFSEQSCVLSFAAIAHGAEAALEPIARAWLYSPLLHSEHLWLQRTAREKLFVTLHSAPQRHRPFLESFCQYSARHEAVVKRFGRFPFRNALLGRASTPAEHHFMAQQLAAARAANAPALPPAPPGAHAAAAPAASASTAAAAV